MGSLQYQIEAEWGDQGKCGGGYCCSQRVIATSWKRVGAYDQFYRNEVGGSSVREKAEFHGRQGGL